eukprot:3262903-Pyramimonas_sp.AAC.1
MHVQLAKHPPGETNNGQSMRLCSWPRCSACRLRRALQIVSPELLPARSWSAKMSIGIAVSPTGIARVQMNIK